MPLRASRDPLPIKARAAGATPARSSGRKQNTPVGPCLVESLGGRLFDIEGVSRGQSSVALPAEGVQAAQDDEHLVLLD